MAENWEPGQGRTERRLRSMEKPGSIDGRVNQAAPVPDRDRQQHPAEGTLVYVQDTAPEGVEVGTLWFDTTSDA